MSPKINFWSRGQSSKWTPPLHSQWKDKCRTGGVTFLIWTLDQKLIFSPVLRILSISTRLMYVNVHSLFLCTEAKSCVRAVHNYPNRLGLAWTSESVLVCRFIRRNRWESISVTLRQGMAHLLILILYINFCKPTAELQTYIAGKPTSNVGSRFCQTDKYSRFFSN